uniref:Reverse transcriptase Ty1/copia-type domain-containing protein n=1 Tax=Tanacetum cinerariifolium TaxID=118510 RepID=A0A6L2KDA7_TANCI|nr:hypothetical protein [Tanacetum cinerariifolium]
MLELVRSRLLEGNEIVVVWPAVDGDEGGVVIAVRWGASYGVEGGGDVVMVLEAVVAAARKSSPKKFFGGDGGGRRWPAGGRRQEGRGVFLESEMISKEDSGSKIDLEEIQESTDGELIVNTDTQQEVVTPIKPNDISLPIRKTSSKVSKPSQDPQFYYGFLIEEDKISDSTLTELNEPANYKEPMASPEAAEWKVAMKSEIQSMYDNQVWNLVDTTPGLKTVRCKWIFKKKTDMDGKAHTYKASTRMYRDLSLRTSGPK